jgi:hypothetical protein
MKTQAKAAPTDFTNKLQTPNAALSGAAAVFGVMTPWVSRCRGKLESHYEK